MIHDLFGASFFLVIQHFSFENYRFYSIDEPFNQGNVCLQWLKYRSSEYLLNLQASMHEFYKLNLETASNCTLLHQNVSYFSSLYNIMLTPMNSFLVRWDFFFFWDQYIRAAETIVFAYLKYFFARRRKCMFSIPSINIGALSQKRRKAVKRVHI